jgi:hypothetical protein
MQFLVIAKVVPGVPMEKVLPLVKPEAEKVWEYYAADMVRNTYYIADMSGAVLLWEAPSLEVVKEMVAQLPMVQEGVLETEITPLKPYTGTESLFAKRV